MLVLEGQLAETVYSEEAISADGKSVQARLGRTRLHSAGTLAYINDSVGLHKVANTAGGRAVSLHVYAPGWLQPPLFDEARGGRQRRRNCPGEGRRARRIW